MPWRPKLPWTTVLLCYVKERKKKRGKGERERQRERREAVGEGGAYNICLRHDARDQYSPLVHDLII